MLGIADMFAEFDGYQRYEAAIEQWADRRREERDAYIREYRSNAINRRIAVEKSRAWKKANPGRAREHAREAHQAWKLRDPAGYRAWMKRAKARYRERHPEKIREWNRKNQLDRRTRLEAEGVCLSARGHGKATHGKYCEACFMKRRKHAA